MKADIVGGAGKNIQVIVDNVLDVTATGDKYGFVSFTNGLSTSNQTVNIDAGEVSLLIVEPTSTKVREDRKDVELG